jgi:hypothetical protein
VIQSDTFKRLSHVVPVAVFCTLPPIASLHREFRLEWVDTIDFDKVRDTYLSLERESDTAKPRFMHVKCFTGNLRGWGRYAQLYVADGLKTGARGSVYQWEVYTTCNTEPRWKQPDTHNSRCAIECFKSVTW